MSSQKYDVAFAPINKRLIYLSFQLSKLLDENNISSTILKTSLISSDHNGWNDLDSIHNFEGHTTPIPQINYLKNSNFFTYSYRVIKSRLAMRKTYKPNFTCLIVFMDDFAEAEILIPLMKAHRIPVILFQDGFFVRDKKYDFDLYSLGKFLRSRILPYFFTPKNYSENANYIFSWSDYGFKDFLDSIKINPKIIKIIGYPFQIGNKKLDDTREFKKILILHSPLPSLVAEEGENLIFINIIKLLDKFNFDLFFKAHPRTGFKKIINLIKEHMQKGIIKKVSILDSSLSSEALYGDYDILIMTPSASSIDALYRGIPVIFIKSKYNKVKLIEDLAINDQVLLIDDINKLPQVINKLNNDLSYRDSVISSGYEAARKIGGELDIFNNTFPLEIKKILDTVNYDHK